MDDVVIKNSEKIKFSVRNFSKYFCMFVFQELDGNVAMKDLYFAYPANKSRLVLKGVSLFFPKGKTVALVGPSGCGKSTIIQLIERLYDPIDGKLVRFCAHAYSCLF